MSWLGNLHGFETSFGKNAIKDIVKKPTRLLFNADPIGTKVTNAWSGQNEKPIFNQFGGPNEQYFQRYADEGGDPTAGMQFGQVADTVAGAAGAAGLGNVIGMGANAAGLGTNAAGAMTPINNGLSGGTGWTLGEAAAGSGAADGLLGSGASGALPAIGDGLSGGTGWTLGNAAEAAGAGASALPAINNGLSTGNGVSAAPTSAFDQAKGLLGNQFVQKGVGAALGVAANAMDKKAADEAAYKNLSATEKQIENGSLPGYAKPYVTGALDRSKTISEKPYVPYAGKLVADQSQATKDSQAQMQSWAGGTPQSAQMSEIYKGMAGNPNKFDVNTAQMTPTTNDNTAQMRTSMTQSQGAYNPMIGQTTSSVNAQGSVSGQAQKLNNSYLGQNAQGIAGVDNVSAGTNKMMGMDNPYLNKAIDQAQGDTVRNYSLAVRPREDTAMQQSGSFGNTGLLEMQNEGQRNLAGELGRISSGMRMQDYGAQQQLAESDVNRQLGAGQYNASNKLNTQQYNSGVGQSNLGRNAALEQSQGQFNAGTGLDAAKFDASMGSNTNQFNAGLQQSDLGRNSSLYQNQGQFNAGAANTANQFNASARNNANQFNAGARNSNNQFNTSALNNASQFNANALNNNNQFNSTLAANQQQQGLLGLGNLDQRGLQGAQVSGLLGTQNDAYNQRGLDSAYEQWKLQNGYDQTSNNQYIDNLRQLTFGGMASTPQVQAPKTNPILAGLGGALTLSELYNSWNK